MKVAAKAFSSLPKESYIAGLTLLAIAGHLILRYAAASPPRIALLPLFGALIIGGIPLVSELAKKLFKMEFGSDLLAGVSILTAVLLAQYLVATIVVLMLSGGAALEFYATAKACSVLDELAKRVPSIAHRREGSVLHDVKLEEIRVGDLLTVFPHEICPVDGEVLEGHGVMDEAYLTGEPYEISKTPGSKVISGAINGEQALTIRAEKLAVDSRYARIMRVMHETEQQKPRIRRLGDRLGAWYTPLALAVAGVAGFLSADAHRFLAVVVIATPCPLLLGIPTAIVGAISLSARRGIIIKNPGILEQIASCRTLIFDKTGTLTYGRPALLLGIIEGQKVQITGRGKVASEQLPLPPLAEGLECLVFIDGRYAAALRFHDTPRKDSRTFIAHLRPRHGVRKVMLVSGDRESEVKYLAETVGITEVRAGASPEEKVEIVKRETAHDKTLFVGDGINDAPALLAATVGVAFGSASDIAAKAADAVVLELALGKIDELMHIGRRMRRIALQSALGGMIASLVGMIFAAGGYLPPIGGAIGQELIDLFAVLNAVRAALPTDELQDF